ncbi:MAG TPA: PEP-CTERM sorting domain-containing protein [Bryobacteraceae bacterium]|nr:PEP-CTERM sorting domain-containing protein [Bryobacteraceae bacterium]
MIRSLVLTCVLLAFGGVLPAASYAPVGGTNVVVSVVTDFSTLANWDIRGAGSLVATPPGTAFGIFDSVGGTDMAFSGALPYGNAVLFMQAGSDFGQLTFDFGSPIFLGPDLVLGAVGTPLTSISDIALQGAIANSPLTFLFAYASTTQIPNESNYLVQWQLSAAIDSASAEVPEPATFILTGVAGLLICSRRRRAAGC